MQKNCLICAIALQDAVHQKQSSAGTVDGDACMPVPVPRDTVLARRILERLKNKTGTSHSDVTCLVLLRRFAWYPRPRAQP